MIIKSGNSYAENNSPHSVVEMAVAVLVERIANMPKEDKQDLYDLYKALLEAESEEEVASARRGMEEILEQAPLQASPIVIPESDGGADQFTAYISNRITELRKEAGLTQEQLAERSGLTQSHVSRLEAGQHTPNNITINKLAKALGVDPGKLDPTL
jgi:DNA-binding XRE family transcriptional regulator